MKYLLLVLPIFLASACSQLPTNRNISSAEWPTRGWAYLLQENPERYYRYRDSESCREFVRYWIADEEPGGLKTDQLVVVKNGKVFFEYAESPYGDDKPHSLWSASKSVTATLVGAALQRGVLHLEDKLSDFYPASLRTDKGPYEKNYEKITIEDLLEMGSGFEWSESYEGDIRSSSVLDMVYLRGWKDMALFALQSPIRPEGPGKFWRYSSGNSNLLMGILKKKMGDAYKSMPWDFLFNPLGMKSARFERDASGTFVGSSYVYASAQDMAKIGYLLLHDGIWAGKRILPEGWTEYVTEISPAMLAPLTTPEYIKKEEGVFGRTVWLNKPVKGIPKPFPNAPDDMFFAAGHYGQLIYVIPSMDLVIARNGYDTEYWSKIDTMVSKAVDCFSQGF